MTLLVLVTSCKGFSLDLEQKKLQDNNNFQEANIFFEGIDHLKITN